MKKSFYDVSNLYDAGTLKFNLNETNIFESNYLDYADMNDEDKKVFNTNHNRNKQFFRQIASSRRVITILIRANRGDMKSKLARAIALIYKKLFTGFEFEQNNICFSVQDFYNLIRAKVDNDNDKRCLIVQDETPESQAGVGTQTLNSKIESIIDLIRVNKINIIRISPDLQTPINFTYDVELRPYAYQEKENKESGEIERSFFVLYRRNNSTAMQDYDGNIIIPDNETPFCEFFKIYDKRKKEYNKKVAREQNESSDNAYFDIIYELHDNYGILNHKYKPDKNGDMKDIFLTNDEFAVLCKMLNKTMFAIAEIKEIWALYKMILVNFMDLYDAFKDYCEKNNMEFTVNDNLKELQE